MNGQKLGKAMLRATILLIVIALIMTALVSYMYLVLTHITFLPFAMAAILVPILLFIFTVMFYES